ncbi:MAG: hypothetical protein ACRDOD_02020 [Streptosporangiaceae bacterium]
MLTASNPDALGYAGRAGCDPADLAFRFLVAVDVEGFSRRPAAEQAKAQDDLEHAMAVATTRAGLDRRGWYRQPRGDGELAVLSPDVNGLTLVADYPRCLAKALNELNASVNRGSRLRVRLAIHHGAIFPGGPFGPVGMAPVIVSRLVDAQVLRQALSQHGDADVALMVSATVYDEIISSEFHNLNPEMFCRTIFNVKGSRIVGYLAQRCPGSPDPGIAPEASQKASVAVPVPTLVAGNRSSRRRRRPPVLAESDLATPAIQPHALADPRRV